MQLKKLIIMCSLAGIILAGCGQEEVDQQAVDKFNQSMEALSMPVATPTTPEPPKEGVSSEPYGNIDKSKYDVLGYKVYAMELAMNNGYEDNIVYMEGLDKYEVEEKYRMIYVDAPTAEEDKNISVWKSDFSILEDGAVVVVIYEKGNHDSVVSISTYWSPKKGFINK
jgi:hypothetical protein